MNDPAGMRWLTDRLGTWNHDTHIAIAMPTASFTYVELASASLDTGDLLVPLSRGAVVGVRFKRSDPLGLVAALAVWHAGGAPLFLDADASSEAAIRSLRLAGAVAELGARPGTGATALAASAINVKALDPGGYAKGGELATEAGYLIATSGSTSAPRICVNRGTSLRNTVLELVDRFRVDERTRMLQFAPYNYDAWLGDAIPVLVAGGTLVYGAPGHWQTFGAISERLSTGRVTHLVAPPSVWSRLMPTGRLQVAVAAGETLTPAVARHMARFADVVINAYGPSEAAVCTATHVYQSSDDEFPSVPLGDPLPGVKVILMPTEFPDVGLLRICGRGVAAGYLGGGSTGTSGDGFGTDSEGRYFQTSDRVRSIYGHLFHVGRADRAFKRHGRLVDLDRIEAVIRVQAGIGECVVYERDGRLVCEYETTNPSTDPYNVFENALEAWEIPQEFVLVSQLGRTPSDKLMRADDRGGPWSDPVTELWAEVLGRPPSDGSFFAAGGDSMLAMELIAKMLTQLGVEVDLAEFVAEPTLGFLRNRWAPAPGDPG